MPASGLSWTVAIEHCPSNCHEHIVETFDDVASGQFVMPDHTYPSHVQLRLTATDSFGRSTTKSQNLTYATVSLALRTGPSGGKVTLDDIVYTTPANVTVLKGSNHQLTVSNTQTIGGSSRTFIAWSDGGAASHDPCHGEQDLSPRGTRAATRRSRS